jgi:hypothetical protein
MRLDPAEVPELPLAAALLDGQGGLLAATPEWRGAGPDSTVYALGRAHLVVASEVSTPELDALVSRLLEEMQAAGRTLPAEDGRRLEVLRAGLALVAGRPPVAEEGGSSRQVLELAAAAISARTQGMSVRLVEPPVELAAPSPGALALALTQLAVNAQQHQGVDDLRLRVAPGPTFYVEWVDPARGSAPVSSHRHPLRRTGWGWGYVQMVADALGASALPPGPTGEGMVGACLGLGAPQLTLPLALARGRKVERATLTWEQDRAAPALGASLAGRLRELAELADRVPGRIAYLDLYRARRTEERTWLALAPESGASRARDLVRGLAHERSLWQAPEPLATRQQGLTALLGVALGEPWPSVSPAVWESTAPSAAAALGVSLPARVETLVVPDPRLVAVLLSELEGALVRRGEDLFVQPSPSRPAPAWLAALAPLPGLGVRVNGGPPS